MARKSEVAVTTVQESEYNGFPMLVLPVEGKPHNPVQLGVKKVAAVLANLEACKAFVAKHEKKESKVNLATLSAAEKNALLEALLAAKA